MAALKATRARSPVRVRRSSTASLEIGYGPLALVPARATPRSHPVPARRLLDAATRDGRWAPRRWPAPPFGPVDATVRFIVAREASHRLTVADAILPCARRCSACRRTAHITAIG